MAWNVCRVRTTNSRQFLLKLSQLCYSKFEVDAIDTFTSQLLQQKLGKWENKKRENEIAFLENTKCKSKPLKRELEKLDTLSNDALNTLFLQLLDTEDVKEVSSLIELCYKNQKSPPSSTLMKILNFCAQNGEKESVVLIQSMYQKHHLDVLSNNSHFNHFLAYSIWIKGDVCKALEIFEQVYRENVYLRRQVRLMFRNLTSILVANGSEAALANMIQFSERLVRDFQDYTPMSWIWQACFLSEWYHDQSIALELIEKNLAFCHSIRNRVSYVVLFSLKCDRTEIVYRLLEVLLKYKMRSQCAEVLVALLEYQLKFGDLQRCSEILKWSTENDVILPQTTKMKVIHLLLNQKMKSMKTIEENQHKYDFKF